MGRRVIVFFYLAARSHCTLVAGQLLARAGVCPLKLISSFSSSKIFGVIPIFDSSKSAGNNVL